MDEKIISLIKSKQEKGIKLLLEQYGGLMKAIALKYLASRPQELEETMADITIAIWYHIDDFDSRKNTFKNWVAAIAKFKAIEPRLRIHPPSPKNGGMLTSDVFQPLNPALLAAIAWTESIIPCGEYSWE